VTATATCRLVAGTIYGTDATPPNLPNTANQGAALYINNGTAERGTFSGETWTPGGNLTTTNETIQ
jgi:hypothetical protein